MASIRSIFSSLFRFYSPVDIVGIVEENDAEIPNFFNFMPPEIFYEFFRYLPLREKIRIGRVNEQFRRMSAMVVADTKSIDFDDASFRNWSPEGYSHLFRHCSPKVNEIKIREYWYEIGERGNRSKLETLVQFVCPRLSKLTVRTANPIDRFGDVIKNSPNLQELHWIEQRNCVFPVDVICENLQRLRFSTADDGTFRSMTGKCSNMKSLKIFDCSVSHDIFDGFFAACPNIECLHVRFDDSVQLRFDRMINFWRLKAMREMTMENSSFLFNDDDLQRISTSFRWLEELHLEQVYLSNRGMAAVTTLKKLRKLHMYANQGAAESLDTSIRRLIQCDHLEEMNLSAFDITSTTFYVLFKSCKKLCYVSIRAIIDVNTGGEAAMVLKSIVGLIGQRESIAFWIGYWNGLHWNSEPVRAVQEKMKMKGCEFLIY